MFERVKTHLLANGGGPDAQAFDLRLGNFDRPCQIEAWIGNFGSSNVHIARGKLTLAQCQGLLETGISDFLMTLTASGPTRVLLPDDTREITVFYEAANTSGQFQAVTVRVYEIVTRDE